VKLFSKKKAEGTERHREVKADDAAPRHAAEERSLKEKRAKFHGAPGLLIQRPHLSEKSVKLRDNRAYVFVVRKNANRPQIKTAIEAIFGVKVLHVRLTNMPGKVKRLGKTEGWRPGYKKAFVTLKEGNKIELG